MQNNDYQNLLAAFHSPEAKQVQIPLQGSLALLAMGDIGLIAWRHAKQVFAEQQQLLRNTPPGIQTNSNEQ